VPDVALHRKGHTVLSVQENVKTSSKVKNILTNGDKTCGSQPDSQLCNSARKPGLWPESNIVKTLQTATVLLTAMLISGCGEAPSDAPKIELHPVMGIVCVDGKPAKGVHVVLHPVNDSSPAAVTPNGITDETGVFKLTTYAVADGAPEGKYQVSFSWPEATAPGAGDSDDFVEKLPEQYQFAASSGIELDVNANNEEMPMFELSVL